MTIDFDSEEKLQKNKRETLISKLEFNLVLDFNEVISKYFL